MLFTKREFKKPELTDPADIRDLNENSDSLEEHLNAITGYDYGKTIVLGTDAVEINKIHLNKIPADPDFGKYYLVLTGSTWDTSTREEYNMNINPSIESKLPKGNVSTDYDTAEKIENKIEGLYESIPITIINSKVTKGTAYRIGKHVTVSLRIDTGASSLPATTNLVQLSLPSNLVVVRNHIATFATFEGGSASSSNIDFDIDGLIRNNGISVPAGRRGTIELMFEIL